MIQCEKNLLCLDSSLCCVPFKKNSFFIKSVATEPFSLSFKSANPSPWLPPPLHLQPLGLIPGWTAGRRNLSGSGVHFDTGTFCSAVGKWERRHRRQAGRREREWRKWISVPISSTAPVSHPGRISNTMFYKLMFLEVGQGYPQPRGRRRTSSVSPKKRGFW